MFTLRSIAAFVALSGYATAGLVKRQATTTVDGPEPSTTANCANPELAIPLRLVLNDDPSGAACESFLLQGPQVTETVTSTVTASGTTIIGGDVVTETVDATSTAINPTATITLGAPLEKRQAVVTGTPGFGPHARAVLGLGDQILSDACECQFGPVTRDPSSTESVGTTTVTVTTTQTNFFTSVVGSSTITVTNVIATTTVDGVVTETPQPTGSCPSFGGVQNGDFEATQPGDEFPPWSHSLNAVLTDDTANDVDAGRNSVLFNGVFDPTETYFISQDVSTCADSTFEFSARFLPGLIGDNQVCRLRATYGPSLIAESLPLVSSEELAFQTLSGSFTGFASPQALRIQATCESGQSDFLIYIDDVVVQAVGGVPTNPPTSEPTSEPTSTQASSTAQSSSTSVAASSSTTVISSSSTSSASSTASGSSSSSSGSSSSTSAATTSSSSSSSTITSAPTSTSTSSSSSSSSSSTTTA